MGIIIGTLVYDHTSILLNINRKIVKEETYVNLFDSCHLVHQKGAWYGHLKVWSYVYTSVLIQVSTL